MSAPLLPSSISADLGRGVVLGMALAWVLPPRASGWPSPAALIRELQTHTDLLMQNLVPSEIRILGVRVFWGLLTPTSPCRTLFASHRPEGEEEEGQFSRSSPRRPPLVRRIHRRRRHLQFNGSNHCHFCAASIQSVFAVFFSVPFLPSLPAVRRPPRLMRPRRDEE